MTDSAPDTHLADMWLLNLHDVFLTANLVHSLMTDQAIPPDRAEFDVSPRGRLERCWHRDLFVLWEAWDRIPEAYREVLRRRAETAFDLVEELLARSDVRAAYPSFRATRDYMSHRDRREYWDDGRLAPARVALPIPVEIESAFGRYFLEAMSVRE